jgi:hypothetical protein
LNSRPTPYQGVALPLRYSGIRWPNPPWEPAGKGGAITYEGGERKVSGEGKSAKDVRLEKLEAALRENLKRRKAQARARKAREPQEGDTKVPPPRPERAEDPE